MQRVASDPFADGRLLRYTVEEGTVAMERSDVELGDELIEVERRPRAGVVVSVRISADEADALQALAERRRATLSQVAKEAIVAYLSRGPVRQTAAVP